MDRRPCRRQAVRARRADPRKHFDSGREGRHLEKPGSADFAGASRLHQEPPEEIRHRTDHDQRRRQPAAAVRRAARAGSARCLVPASDPADRQRARRAAEGDDRDGQEAQRAGRGVGRRQGARDPSGRGRRRYSGGAGHRGRRPLRRGFHHGAGARGDQGHQADPRRAGAGGGRHHDRTADGGVHGDGRGRRMDRFGVAGHGRIRNHQRSSARR